MKITKILTLILILFFTFLSLFQLNPPATVSQSAPVGEFSSARAMEHLQVIAQKPHPIGSLENVKVRDYIVKQLKALGLNPEIQQTTVVNQRWGVPYISGTVQNVLARLKGTENNKAILITAHYDSVANGPGASDDGAAVAAMLEAIRALKASTRLKNDIIFLFSDGEEVGLLGAKAFVDEHPWAKDIGVAFNFEARGNSGSTVMFETSDNNGQLIKEFSSAAVHPITSSLFNSVYKLLPNDTDFSIYKEAGFAGLNFAYMSGVIYYHTFFDNLKTIDERSLQHQGAYALSLARHFGNLDITNLKTRDAVYFDVLGLVLIHYEQYLAIIFTITIVLLFIAITILGLRKKLLTVRGIILGFLAQLISIISSAVIVTLTWLTITNLQTEYQSILQGDTYNSNFYMIAFVVLAVAISSQIYLWFSKKVSLQNLVIGSSLWWLLLMVLSNLYLPGASYLFTFPLLFTLVGLLIIFASNQNNTWQKNFIVVLAICSIPAIIVLIPTIYLTFIALTLEMSGIVVILVSLLVGLLIPLLFVITAPKKSQKKSLLPIGALLISVSFIVAGSFTANFDANHPKPNSVFYALNADTKQAIWASADRQPDEWTSQFFSTNTEKVKLPEYLPLTSFKFLTAPAPTASTPAPNIEVISNEVRDDIQTLNLRVISPRQGRVVNIYLNPKVKVLAAAVNNKKINHNSNQSWALNYYALPKEGIELKLQIKRSSPLNLKLVDRTDGLPQRTGKLFQPRPNDMMPTTFGLEVNDSTLVSKTFNL